MNRVPNYVNAVKVIFDRPYNFVSVVDKHGEIVYLSDTLHKLGTSNTEHISTNSITLGIAELESLNNYIIQTGVIVKYIYVLQTTSTDFIIFRCKKHPIYEVDRTPSAVLTIQHIIKRVNLNTDYHYFEIPNYTLNDIEKLILFYASIGFSYQDSYKLIIKYTDTGFKYQDFEQYCKQILQKFQAECMDDIIMHTKELWDGDFIPQSILKNGLLLRNGEN